MQNENQNIPVTVTTTDNPPIVLPAPTLTVHTEPTIVIEPSAPVVPAAPPVVEYSPLVQSHADGLALNGRVYERDNGAYLRKEGYNEAVLSLHSFRWLLCIKTVRPSGTPVVHGRWSFPPANSKRSATLKDRDDAFLKANEHLDYLLRHEAA